MCVGGNAQLAEFLCFSPFVVPSRTAPKWNSYCRKRISSQHIKEMAVIQKTLHSSMNGTCP